MFEDTNDVIISHNRIQLPSERGKKKDKQWSVKYYTEKIEQHELYKTPEGWFTSSIGNPEISNCYFSVLFALYFWSSCQII
jgi:hypothetical protein